MYRPCLHCEGKRYDESVCPEICTYGEAKKRLKELEKCIEKINDISETIVVDDIDIIRKMVIHGLYKVCLEKNYGPAVFNKFKAEQNRLFDNYISTTHNFLKEKLTLSEEQLEYLNTSTKEVKI